MPAPPDDPCATFLHFYGGVIDVGVDPVGRFVGLVVLGDLHPDEPLLLPSANGKFSRRTEFPGVPLHLLLDDAGRVVGVHVYGQHRATRLCDINPGLATPEQRQALDARRVSIPSGRWPANAEEFNALMEHLDQQVQDVPVQLRPLHALPLASKLLGQPIRMFGRSDTPRPGVFSDEDFVIRASNWFKARYGDRLKVSMSPGSFVIRWRGTTWECPIPRFYGQWEFFCHRTEPSVLKAVAPATRPRFNILDAVRDLPETTRFQLADADLQSFIVRFRAARDTFGCLESVAEHAFTIPIFGDFAACVHHLMGEHPQFGQARWSALQAAEKVTKLALDVAAADFPKVHDMAALDGKLSAAGYPSLPPGAVAALNFKAAVRYGEVPSTLDEAIAAHNAAFDIGALLGPEIVKRRPPPKKPWLLPES